MSLQNTKNGALQDAVNLLISETQTLKEQFDLNEPIPKAEGVGYVPDAAVLTRVVAVEADQEGILAIDFSQGNVFKTELTGDVTITFNESLEAFDGMSGMLLVRQDDVGGHLITWPGSPTRARSGEDLTPTADAEAIDIYSFVIIDGLVFVTKAADWQPIFN